MLWTTEEETETTEEELWITWQTFIKMKTTFQCYREKIIYNRAGLNTAPLCCRGSAHKQHHKLWPLKRPQTERGRETFRERERERGGERESYLHITQINSNFNPIWRNSVDSVQHCLHDNSRKKQQRKKSSDWSKKMYKYPTSLLFCLFPESRLLLVLATKQQ